MCPWPVVSSASRMWPGMQPDLRAVAELDLALPRQRDDVLPARRRVPVDEVLGRRPPELDAGHRDRIGQLGGTALTW